MKIIISPTKKMRRDTILSHRSLPSHLDKTKVILETLRTKSIDELKAIWNASDEIVEQNKDRLDTMDLYSNLSPAILSYDGIAFKYMAPNVFSDQEFEYVDKHLCILSAFYGVLHPWDGVTPYRLEMQAKLTINHTKDLYEYWNNIIYKDIDDDIIINLASDEYASIVEKYITKKNRYITILFGEMVNGKLKTKGTIAKMARGAMVRYMAENLIEDVEEIKKFSLLSFRYKEDLSNETLFVFIRIQ